MLWIKGEGVGRLDVKRFNIEGIRAKYECPKCKNIKDWHSWNGDSYNYPIMGEWTELGMYCEECDHEWNEKIILTVKIDSICSENNQ